MTDDLEEAKCAYRAAPSGDTLRGLLCLEPSQLRRELLEAFRETEQWRIAQHLALAWSNVVQPHALPDLVRAAYFAHKACELSNGHPLARWARAEGHWHRRLAHLVLGDVEHAMTEVDRVDELGQREHLIARLMSLRICALSYLGRLDEALELAKTRETTPFGISHKAALQCFIAIDPQQEALRHEAAILGTRRLEIFGPRPADALRRTLPQALLRVLNGRVRTDV